MAAFSFFGTSLDGQSGTSLNGESGPETHSHASLRLNPGPNEAARDEPQMKMTRRKLIQPTKVLGDNPQDGGGEKNQTSQGLKFSEPVNDRDPTRVPISERKEAATLREISRKMESNGLACVQFRTVQRKGQLCVQTRRVRLIKVDPVAPTHVCPYTCAYSVAPTARLPNRESPLQQIRPSIWC